MNNKDNFLPYSKQNIIQKDIEAVIRVLKEEFITQGPMIRKFEEEIEKKVQVKNAIAVNSATSALHLCCLALNIGRNDYVWTSPNSFVASANCARYCGANVDFIDINLDNGLICLEALKEKLKLAEKNNTLPKLIILVHFAGSACNLSEIYELSKKYNFFIIEDASHAIGGFYKNNPVGNCKYSIFTVFSFHPVKIITTGEGGVITTNDNLLAVRLKELRSHGITRDQNKFITNTGENWIYEQHELGFNYRMNDIEAALGLSQLERLDEIIFKRNQHFNFYQDLIKKLPFKLLEIPENVKSSIHLAVIKLEINKPGLQKFLFDKLRDCGIGVQVHYFPIHLQPYYRNLGFQKGDFPNCEILSSTCLSIPLFEEITTEEQKRVIIALKNNIEKFV